MTTISSVFHEYDNDHTAGATNRQGMLTPPICSWAPDSTSIILEAHVCSALYF